MQGTMDERERGPARRGILAGFSAFALLLLAPCPGAAKDGDSGKDEGKDDSGKDEGKDDSGKDKDGDRDDDRDEDRDEDREKEQEDREKAREDRLDDRLDDRRDARRDRLDEARREGTREVTLRDGTRVAVSPGRMTVLYRDGYVERIAAGRYELRDRRNALVIERPATREDSRRIEKLVAP